MDYSNSKMKSLILEYIHSERDRKVLFLSLINEISYEEIGYRVGLTSRQVGTIVRKGKEIVFRHYDEK